VGAIGLHCQKNETEGWTSGASEFGNKKLDDLKNPGWPKLDGVAEKSTRIRIGIKKWIELKCGAKTERNPCK